MKIVNFGAQYEIYSNDLKTYDQLPAATYKVVFNPMAGFSLIKIDNFETIEEKIYGQHEQKIDKVLTSYDNFNRSLGVILSGEKGMGKSLFVQMLAKKAIAKGLPVIMVTKAYGGVAEFIESIDQEVLVIFDEFEKVFKKEAEKGESQNDLLGLFDGTSQKKRIYAITVNKLYEVSEFMVNRTGRFHYHIRFDYPGGAAIKTYLMDKLDPAYYEEIPRVVTFAGRVKLNYDSLRAIAFELNQGHSFAEAIADLNILTVDRQRYDVHIAFSNGHKQKLRNCALDLFNEDINFDLYMEDDWCDVAFPTSAIQESDFSMRVEGDYVTLERHKNNKLITEEVYVEHVSIQHAESAKVNYHLV